MAKSATELAQEVDALRQDSLQRLYALANAKAEKRAKQEALEKEEYERQMRMRTRAENEGVKSAWGGLGAGAGAGAGIGSLFGPGGTAIGAGIGALAGLALGTGAEVNERKALDKMRGKKTKSTLDYLGKSLGRAPTLQEGMNLLGGAGQVAGSYAASRDKLATAQKQSGLQNLYDMAYQDQMMRRADAGMNSLTEQQKLSGSGQTFDPVSGAWAAPQTDAEWAAYYNNLMPYDPTRLPFDPLTGNK